MNPFITIAVMVLAAVVATAGNLACEAALRQWYARRKPKCGRVVCAWCKPQRDIGPALLMPAGEITHGICPECMKRELGIAA